MDLLYEFVVCWKTHVGRFRSSHSFVCEIMDTTTIIGRTSFWRVAQSGRMIFFEGCGNAAYDGSVRGQRPACRYV